MSIRPQDFESDHPPIRPIGTECEYNQQLKPGSGIESYQFLNNALLHACGINIDHGYLGEKHGAGKAYPDVGHLELDTRESMGPASAAVEDIKGIDHLTGIVEATRFPHKGIYRLAGTYIQNGLIENGTRTSNGRSSGYHESYLFARYLEYSAEFGHLMPSSQAYQIWSRGGTLRSDGFVFSQKVWGNGGAPIEHSLSRRTTHGQKPMITVPSMESDADTIGAKKWARAEIRMPDPGLSLVNRFLSFANVSLTLRLVEQRRRLDLTQKRLAAICLADPVGAAQSFAKDLTLRQAVPTINGRHLTALNGQEALLELYEILAEKVSLPEDEVIAIAGIRSVVDALRASQPEKADYTAMARLRVEFAPKHQFVGQGKEQSVINAKSKIAMHRNIEWSRILPAGPGLRYWQKAEDKDPLAGKVRALAAVAPVSKRSTIRANIVDNPKGRQVINWAYYSDETGNRRWLASPAGD